MVFTAELHYFPKLDVHCFVFMSALKCGRTQLSAHSTAHARESSALHAFLTFLKLLFLISDLGFFPISGGSNPRVFETKPTVSTKSKDARLAVCETFSYPRGFEDSPSLISSWAVSHLFHVSRNFYIKARDVNSSHVSQQSQHKGRKKGNCSCSIRASRREWSVGRSGRLRQLCVHTVHRRRALGKSRRQRPELNMGGMLNREMSWLSKCRCQITKEC